MGRWDPEWRFPTVFGRRLWSGFQFDDRIGRHGVFSMSPNLFNPGLIGTLGCMTDGGLLRRLPQTNPAPCQKKKSKPTSKIKPLSPN